MQPQSVHQPHLCNHFRSLNWHWKLRKYVPRWRQSTWVSSQAGLNHSPPRSHDSSLRSSTASTLFHEHRIPFFSFFFTSSQPWRVTTPGYETVDNNGCRLPHLHFRPLWMDLFPRLERVLLSPALAELASSIHQRHNYRFPLYQRPRWVPNRNVSIYPYP